MALDWTVTRFLRSWRSSLWDDSGEGSGDRSRLRGEERCGEFLLYGEAKGGKDGERSRLLR